MRTSTLVSGTAHLAVIAALLWTQQALDAQDVSALAQVEVLFVAPSAPAAGGGESADVGPVRTGPHHARASGAPPAPAPSVDASGDAPVPAPPETAQTDRPEEPAVQPAEAPEPVEQPEPVEETVESLSTPDPPVTQQVKVEPPKPMPLPDSKPEAPILGAAAPAEPPPVEQLVEKALAPEPEPASPAPSPTPAETQLTHSEASETVTRETTTSGGVLSASLPSASDDLPVSTGGGEAGNGEVGPAGGGGAVADYAALLAAWLDDHKRYPERARRKHQEGVVVFEFAMDRQGRVIEHRILEGSGYPLLDAEVTELIARASPLPPPPAGAARSYVVPIVFALR